jgi:hypothetical protein
MLVVPDGPSRRVGPNGVLIGRQHDCDIVALDPSVSRRHALIRLTAEGAEVVPLGRAPVAVNGKPCDRVHDLADGDLLELPGLTLTVQVAAQRPDATAPSTFSLERPRGGSFGIVHSPFVIGGGETDDLIVKKWPAQALRFHVAQGELFVEATTDKATKNGAELEAGVLEPLAVDDELGFEQEAFVVRRGGNHDATTAVAGLQGLPRKVVVEMLPRGGRVVFSCSDGDHAVYLADRRLDLIIALLRPPEDYQPGDYIPDDVVRQVVWPRNPGVTGDQHVDHRCRGSPLRGRPRRPAAAAGSPAAFWPSSRFERYPRVTAGLHDRGDPSIEIMSPTPPDPSRPAREPTTT